MLLERSGCQVSLFEARDRIGGRLETSSIGSEAGGEWIDADHERCLSLLNELGLETLPENSFQRLYVHEGHRCTADNLWPDALEHEIRLEAAARELCRNLHRPAWDNWHAKDLDQMTLADFIEKLSTTARGRWYLRAVALSDEGDDPERIGLLGWLTAYQNYLDRTGDEMSAYRIAGGAEALVQRMCLKISASPQLHHTLQRIEQDGSTVLLHFTEGKPQRFDAAVLTLPPRNLEQIVYVPALAAEKRCAIEACLMSRTIKLSFEFESKWWLECGWGGSMQCDLPIQQVWDGSRGEKPILSAYVCGLTCELWTAHPDPVSWGIEQLTSLFPAAAEQFVRGQLHDWNADPYSNGGFSNTPPGYVLNHMRHIATPEGKIHFAGEHASPWLGFIEGALESAERIAQELNALH